MSKASLKINYTGCPDKKHLNIFWYCLLEGYLLFPTVPRNAGSVMSVNEHKHFKDMLTIWLCTKMLRLRLVPSLWYLQTFFPNSWFYWNQTTGKLVGKHVSNLLQATSSIPFSHSENSALLWATSWSVLTFQIC